MSSKKVDEQSKPNETNTTEIIFEDGQNTIGNIFCAF